MGKNQSASGLTNIIQYDNNGNVSFVSGSTTLMQISSSGAITTTGVISGSNALSASYSLNSGLLNGTGSVGFATTGSLLTVSSSQQQISASQQQLSSSFLILTASYTALSSSYTALSGSYNTFSGSASTRITVDSASLLQVSSSQQQISASLLNVISIFATTGSNSFRANQSITGSLVVSSTITAQTLIVQTVTSSIVYSSGSNVFGCDLNSRQTFTGSVNITGSQTVFGNVGINCSSPIFNLDVNGISGFNSNITSGANVAVTATQNGTGYLFVGKCGVSNKFRVGPTGYIIVDENSNNAGLTINQSGAGYSAIFCGGNVGIGTNSPSNKLETNIGTTANGGYNLAFNASTVASSWRVVNPNTDNTTQFGTVNNNDLVFITVNTERLRIMSGGNVGINCTAPNYKLHINGCTAIDGNLRMGSGYSSGNSTDPGITVQGYSNAGVYFSNCGVGLGAGSSSNLLFLSCIGNVGIGICTPIGKLHVYKNGLSAVIGKMSDANILIDSGDYGVSTYNAQIAFGYYSGTFTYAPVAIGFIPTTGTASGYGDLTFNTRALTTDTAPIERMRITSCGKVGIIATDPKWLLEICCNTTATGGGGYPAISINNPNDAGYSAYYFFKGATNMGGMEVSNATCDFLLNTNCTLSFKTNSNTRIRICNTGETYFTCKPYIPGASLTCIYTCTFASYCAGCWYGLFAGDNGYNGAYAFTVVGQLNLNGSSLYSMNYSTVPYIHKSTSIDSTNGNDIYGVAHTSAGHADNGALVCFRRARYASNTPAGNRTEFCMNVSYSTSFTATTYVLAWV